MSSEDDTKSGHPMDATNEEMCNKVRDQVYSERRIQVGKIAQILGISYGSILIILHDRSSMQASSPFGSSNLLAMRKLQPRHLYASALLKCFRSKDNDFLMRLVIVYETD